MDNKASKTRSLNIAFVLEPAQLQRLATVLGEVGGPLAYNVKFSDGSSVQYSDVAEIVGLPNPSWKAITSLTVRAAKDGQSADVTLKTSSEPYVEYTVIGPQQRVTYFGEQLDNWAATTREWYSWFLHGAGYVVFMIAVIFFPIFLANHLPDFFPIPRSWTVGLLLTLAFAESLLFRLFPKGVFAIGHGAKRHQVRAYLRNFLLVPYAISFLASVSANLLKWHL